MDVFGHHDVANHGETIHATNLPQDFYECIARAYGPQQRLSPVATARDEVQVALAVVAH